MKKIVSLKTFIALGAFLLILAACGGGVAINDLPAYPGAVELKAGSSQIGDTLKKNMEQDAALRQAVNSGGQTEQKGFQLPADATWEKVNGFYAKELQASGWTSGLGGIAGGFVDINAMMNQANKGNELFQTSVWSKGKQTLSVIMNTNPTNRQEKTLILSLSTR